MKYRESGKDKQLRAWFGNDMSRALLRGIQLTEGALRGLTPLELLFEYPISAIAGRNGAGKSTLLALVCCAFHNLPQGFKSLKRKNSYYTFSDFFVQHSSEVPPQGLKIRYAIAHNRWKKNYQLPDGSGIGVQVRAKTKGGKWNDYDDRVKRNVVFLGIERIVPHSERSQSRSYSKAFKDAPLRGWEEKVMSAVGYILEKSYEQFKFLDHSKYNLPVVKSRNVFYSGFNMGAGENALFEIFVAIYSAGDGALLVMDEVELGLHAGAQMRFMEKLKEVCLEMHTQVICTTHSPHIFDCLPYEARFYLESVNGKARINSGVSSEFAFAKLSAIPGLELEIFVEDDVAEAILRAALPADLRTRVKVKQIGSGSAIARQLAACYVRGEERAIFAIFDGDQRPKISDHRLHAKKMAENIDKTFNQWFDDRVDFLPGEAWPELWLLQQAAGHLDSLAALLRTDTATLTDILEYGQQAGKHHEFHEIGKHLGLGRDQCLQLFTSVICDPSSIELDAVIRKIREAIKRAH